ncbi:hypothetical protein DFH09DRAFT_1147942 [Mycena vulgaris]|nr:hypothetical protein DFH09DRAFT_1147942 [Mycena vulgaris]
MVNFLHNITVLAGATTVCKIFDFRNSVMTLAGNVGEDGIAIQTTPVVAGAENQNWLIVPQATAGTFTLQNVARPAVFVSYAAAARKVPGHSQAVASDALPTVFKMVTVAGGPAVSLIDTATNTALTAWAIADPETWTSTVTPVCWVVFHPVYACRQGLFIGSSRWKPSMHPIRLCRASRLRCRSECLRVKSKKIRKSDDFRLVNILEVHCFIYIVIACPENTFSRPTQDPRCKNSHNHT